MKRPDGEAVILAGVRRSARRVAQRQEAADRALDDLRVTVRAALAAGVSTRRAAEAAGVSQPRIVQMAKEGTS